MKKILMIPTIAWLLGLAIASSAAASAPRVSVGNAARLPRGARVHGAVAAAHRMRVTIGMASRDPLGLKAFSDAVTTPGTPQYGHFLTVHRFAQRFGASDAAIARVRAALR